MINISLKSQQKIVDEIKTELDKQEEMNRTIEAERNKIDEIIDITNPIDICTILKTISLPIISS